jgi:hypothetical protein
VIAAVLVVGLDHLGETRLVAIVEHVGQQERERLVADNVARAPYGVTESERRLLARKAGAARLRQRLGEHCELVRLAALAERRLELRLPVEMILDRTLVAAGHEDEMLDPRRTRLVDHVLDDGAVDHGQHLLRHRLGRGQEACAEPGHGEHGLADTLRGSGHGKLRNCGLLTGGRTGAVLEWRDAALCMHLNQCIVNTGRW